MEKIIQKLFSYFPNLFSFKYCKQNNFNNSLTSKCLHYEQNEGKMVAKIIFIFSQYFNTSNNNNSCVI